LQADVNLLAYLGYPLPKPYKEYASYKDYGDDIVRYHKLKAQIKTTVIKETEQSLLSKNVLIITSKTKPIEI